MIQIIENPVNLKDNSKKKMLMSDNEQNVNQLSPGRCNSYL